MSLFQLYVKPNNGSVYIDCMVDGMYYPGELMMDIMHLTINGVEQDTTNAEELISQYGFSKARADEWVKSYGGWQIHNDWMAGQNFGLSLPRSTWQTISDPAPEWMFMTGTRTGNRVFFARLILPQR
jgi:hypothetical protein